MDIKGLLLLLLVLVWSGPTVEGKAKKCKRPTGYPGDFAKCTAKGKWERDETLKNIEDNVVENGKKLDELLQVTDQECPMLVFGDYYDYGDVFVPYHVVTNEVDYRVHNTKVDNGNYWLVPIGKTGDEASLFMVFECQRYIKGFMLKNTHNGFYQDHGTQDFTISKSESIDGPWTPILSGTLPDARNVSPVPVMNFKLKNPVDTSYLRFQIDSYYGLGGGLQYFSTY